MVELFDENDVSVGWMEVDRHGLARFDVVHEGTISHCRPEGGETIKFVTTHHVGPGDTLMLTGLDASWNRFA